MITFGEWHKFNFVDNEVMKGLGDIYIKVFRKRSLTSNDKCLEGLMKIEDAVRMFSNYTLFKIGYHTVPARDSYEFDYKVLCALIYLEEEKGNDSAGSN